jgi:hypothetical protein
VSLSSRPSESFFQLCATFAADAGEALTLKHEKFLDVQKKMETLARSVKMLELVMASEKRSDFMLSFKPVSAPDATDVSDLKKARDIAQHLSATIKELRQQKGDFLDKGSAAVVKANEEIKKIRLAKNNETVFEKYVSSFIRSVAEMKLIDVDLEPDEATVQKKAECVADGYAKAVLTVMNKLTPAEEEYDKTHTLIDTLEAKIAGATKQNENKQQEMMAQIALQRRIYSANVSMPSMLHCERVYSQLLQLRDSVEAAKKSIMADHKKNEAEKTAADAEKETLNEYDDCDAKVSRLPSPGADLKPHVEQITALEARINQAQRDVTHSYGKICCLERGIHSGTSLHSKMTETQKALLANENPSEDEMKSVVAEVKAGVVSVDDLRTKIVSSLPPVLVMTYGEDRSIVHFRRPVDQSAVIAPSSSAPARALGLQ